MRSRAFQAAELLLQERSPRPVPFDTPPEEHKVDETPGRMGHCRSGDTSIRHQSRRDAHLLSNGGYHVMVTNRVAATAAGAISP